MLRFANAFMNICMHGFLILAPPGSSQLLLHGSPGCSLFFLAPHGMILWDLLGAPGDSWDSGNSWGFLSS